MDPTAVVQTLGTFAPVYERLFAHCSPLLFPPPWDFLKACRDCHGPVASPTAALADLRARFSDSTLLSAGVLSYSAGEGVRLSPLLSSPSAGLLALRDPLDGQLHGLLTARGCLPQRRANPINAALREHWTSQTVKATGVLFATPHIKEVALLRSLGFPATLSIGIPRLSLSRLKKINFRFGGADFVPPLELPVDAADKEREQGDACFARESFGNGRPTLVLVGWSPLAVSAQPSPALQPALTQLAAARRYLGLPLPGIMGWRLGSEELKNLRFRLTFRDRASIRELLYASTDTLEDFECLLPPEADSTALEKPGMAFATAQDDFVAELAENRTTGPLSRRGVRAKGLYDALVQRTLIVPLQEWALASPDPIIRNAGLQLAAVCKLLHGMSPLLLSLQARRYERGSTTDGALVPTKALEQYLSLTARLGSLVRDLRQWQKS